MAINTIGVLTSGGDAPGMNAAIRAVVRTAKYYDLKVMGIRKGYKGLLHGEIFELSARDVSETMQRGGTFLQTSRCPEFHDEDIRKKAISTAKYFGIEGLVVIGGDGSFRGALDLARIGMPTIGVPATIDNDIPYSEYTIGFDTALNTAIDCVDKVRDTASSHERCNVIKVMGRESGKIALNVAVATGAEVVLIPEKPFDFEEDIIQNIKACQKRGKKHFIIIVAEGVESSEEIAPQVEKATGIGTRLTTLGYIQRGGGPTARDRIIASQMGARAVELLRNDVSGRLVGIKNGQIYDADIFEAMEMKKNDENEIISLAKILSI